MAREKFRSSASISPVVQTFADPTYWSASPGGQSDFLNTAGYEKMGLPGDMVPGLTDDGNGDPFANFDLGLGFHLDSAFRRGIHGEHDTSPETKPTLMERSFRRDRTTTPAITRITRCTALHLLAPKVLF